MHCTYKRKTKQTLFHNTARKAVQTQAEQTKKSTEGGIYKHFINENGSWFSITTSRYILVLVTE